MKFQCSFCFFVNTVSAEFLGERVKCGNCKKVLAIPTSAFGKGRVINQDFVLDKELGSGALGVVYKARQLSLDRYVALKLLYDKFAKDPEYATAFNQEAKAAARITHPNIVQSLAFGDDGGILYFAMTLVEGQTLSDLIERGEPIELDKALNIIQQAAEGLHEAWTEEGLVHRDIKSSNIIVTKEGIALITDLGLARKATDLTSEKYTSGTPAYMSPEQLMHKPLDCRSDLYSLGITLYEILFGEVPFAGENLEEIASKHFYEKVKFPSSGSLLVPSTVQAMIKKMLAKSPDDRFENLESFLTKIVSIRKKMTIHKEVIPNVHTISMNRYKLLDKVPQIKTLAQQKSEEEKLEDQVSTKVRLVPTFLGGFIVGILFLFILSLLFKDPSETPMIKEVNNFIKTNTSIEAVNYNDVLGKAEKIINKYPNIKENHEMLAINALNSFIIDLREKKIQLRNKIYINQIKKINEDKNDLFLQQAIFEEKIKSLNRKSEKIANLKKQVEKEKVSFKQLKIQFARKFSQKNKDSMRKENQHLKSKIANLLNAQKNYIRYIALLYNSKGSFSKSIKFINILKKQHSFSYMYDWIDEKIASIRATEQINKDFLTKSKKLINHTLGEFEIIAYVSGTFTLRNTKTDNIKTMTIRDLSLTQIKKIYTMISKNEDYSSLAYYFLYTFHFKKALLFDPMNEEIKLSIDSFYKFQIINIQQRIDSGDSKQQIYSKLKSIKKLFKNTPWFKKIDQDILLEKPAKL